jgi:hypothetical protein
LGRQKMIVSIISIQAFLSTDSSISITRLFPQFCVFAAGRIFTTGDVT